MPIGVKYTKYLDIPSTLKKVQANLKYT